MYRKDNPRLYFSEDHHDVNHQGKDTRQLLEFYQLNHSQLVFSVVEYYGPRCPTPVVYEASTAYSIIISGQTNQSHHADAEIQYYPRVGDWQGGDEIHMTILRLDQRKSESLHHKTCIDVDIDAGSFSIRSVLRRSGDEFHHSRAHHMC